MREIKFRSWNIRYKKIQVVERMWIPEDKPILGVHNDKFSIGTNWLNGEYEYEFELMQYTGLKDKNGTEIYEGDIVAAFNFDDKFFRHEVIYKNGAFGYTNIIFKEFVPYASNIAFEWIDGKSEKILVLGNIYETPELLEG